MIGTTLGRYDIQEELGQGGMSVVYHGRDRSLGRDVAVKVLHNHLAKKPENRERFHREARAIARLKHTNILEIYDYAQADEEHAFIVMEYVAGVNLREFVEAHGAMPPEYAALVGVELCGALAHAHEEGIIHRDLKPENVMVSTQGAIKLMDFGIAHIFDAETMTQTGSLLGSPAHMAPELIEGERVDVRADVFALGTVLYWLVCGKLPFDGKNAPQILKRVMEGIYKRPEAVDPRVGAALGEVIARCMAHRMEDRYADIRAAGAALAALLKGAPLEAGALGAYLRAPDELGGAWQDRVLPWLVTRGCAAMQAGETGEALRCFNRALGYDPQHPQVCDALARLQRPSGRRAAALVAVGVAAAAGALVMLSPAPPSPAATEQAETRVEAPREPAPTPVEAVDPETLTRAQQAALGAIALANSGAYAELRGAASASETMRAARRAALVISVAQRIKAKQAGVAVAEVTPAEVEPAKVAEAPVEHVYRFNVLPRAASLVILGKKYTALDAGCKPMVTNMDLSAPPAPNSPPRDMVMQWQDGLIQINADFDVFVWLDDASQPTSLVPARKPTTLRVAFGPASLDSPRKTIRLRVSRKNDLLRTRQEVFTLAPGGQHIVAINAASLQ